MSKIDWIKIKNEYINTNISYRKLAEKHGVSFSTLEKKARAENWKDERDKQCDRIEKKVRQKTEQKIVTKEVNRIDRLTSLADRLADKLEQSLEQLDKHIVINSTKTKRDVYIDDDKVEITKEEKKLTTQTGILKINELKQLASTLKDIKDVQVIATSNKPTTETSQLYQALESEND